MVSHVPATKTRDPIHPTHRPTNGLSYELSIHSKNHKSEPTMKMKPARRWSAPSGRNAPPLLLRQGRLISPTSSSSLVTGATDNSVVLAQATTRVRAADDTDVSARANLALSLSAHRIARGRAALDMTMMGRHRLATGNSAASRGKSTVSLIACSYFFTQRQFNSVIVLALN